MKTWALIEWFLNKIEIPELRRAHSELVGDVRILNINVDRKNAEIKMLKKEEGPNAPSS